MSAAGLLASWLALVFGGWSFVAALGAAPARPALRDSARRGLWMAAVGGAAAAVVLATLLYGAQLDVSYVARHISLNLPPLHRVAALLSAPAGAALPAAALVAAAGAWRARESTLGIAVTAATVVALLASSVASPPFARLDWLPAEGMGMSPAMQEWATVWSRVLLLLAVTGAAMAASVAADAMPSGADDAARGVAAAQREAEHSRRVSLDRLTAATAGMTALAIVLDGEGAFLSGMSKTPAPVGEFGALLVVPLFAAILAWQARRSMEWEGLLGCVGLLGSAMVPILGMGGATLPPPLLALAAASLGATTLGAVASALRVEVATARALGAVSAVALGGGGALILAANGGDPVLSPAALPILLAVASVSWGARAPLVRQGAATARVRGRLLLVAGCAALGAGFASMPGGGASTAAWWGVVVGAGVGSAFASVSFAWRSRSPAAWRGVVAGLAVASSALGAAGETIARSETIRLTSGETRELDTRLAPSRRVTHQGVSRYQGVNSHIVAVAMELSGGGTPELVTAERREYVDTREAPLGAAAARPGTGGGTLEQSRFWLDEASPDESVTLSVVSVPFAGGWRVGALAAVVVAALAMLVLRPRSPTLPHAAPPAAARP